LHSLYSSPNIIMGYHLLTRFLYVVFSNVSEGLIVSTFRVETLLIEARLHSVKTHKIAVDIIRGDQIRGGEMGRTCSKCTKDFGWKT
jgi:hypothetical protein